MASSAPRSPFDGDARHSGTTAAQKDINTHSARPHIWEFVLHPFRSLRFVGSLARDRRISTLRKMLYLVVVGALFITVLVPEGIIATGVSALIPVVGPLVAIPADAAVDWLLVASVAYGLLALFPMQLVREHHARIFHARRHSRRA